MQLNKGQKKHETFSVVELIPQIIKHRLHTEIRSNSHPKGDMNKHEALKFELAHNNI